MTTTQENRPTTRRAERSQSMIARRALAGMLVGAAPGAILVLLAEFAVAGEMQLTIGAPGILLAAVGSVVGLVLGAVTGRRTRHGRPDGP